jgi:hypothetical protein
MGNRKWLFMVSGILIAISIVALLVRGLNFGIEFKGGTVITIANAASTTETQIRDAAEKAGLREPIVQSIQGGGYIVRTSEPDPTKANDAADAMIKQFSLSRNDVNVDVIFKELAKQDIYDEIKTEAEWITRDTELLGIDILTAINKAAQRTPSVKFQEFLQGVVTTSRSGGQLKPYFLQKAEQFEKEGKLELRSQMETLGLMAESFVTVVVAFPLFLVVIMAIMAIVPGGGGGGSTVLLLEAVIGLMIPFSQFGFIFFIWNMTKESSF